MLADDAVRPLTVADISGLRLSASLAHLSACGTGETSRGLADESVHITGAFHLAGFRNVIGTLWFLNDAMSAALAAGFYAHLTAGGPIAPKPNLSSRALHRPVA